MVAPHVRRTRHVAVQHLGELSRRHCVGGRAAVLAGRSGHGRKRQWIDELLKPRWIEELDIRRRCCRRRPGDSEPTEQRHQRDQRTRSNGPSSGHGPRPSRRLARPYPRQPAPPQGHSTPRREAFGPQSALAAHSEVAGRSPADEGILTSAAADVLRTVNTVAAGIGLDADRDDEPVDATSVV